MSAGTVPAIAVVGNLIVDDVVYDDGSTRMAQAGGAVVHVALGAALWDVPVGIVSIAGSDYPSEILDRLADRGVNLDGVCCHHGPGMRTWLLYEGSRRRVVHRLGSPPHEVMSPAVGDIPEGWSPAAVHLCPMPLHRQRAWLEHLRAETSAVLSVDPFVLIQESTWADCVEAFAHADALLASEDEVLLPVDIDQRLRWFESGIRLVLFKQGAAGGTVYDGTRRRVLSWEGRCERLVDPTGAGDAFAGGLLAGWCRGEPIERALQKAVVSASFTLESLDVEAMLGVSPAQARARLDHWFGSDVLTT
jgi:sugar/nucleoside kinase (ribokinase family)